MAKRFTISAVFEGIDRITRPITRIQKKIQSFTASATRQFSRTSKSMSGMATGMQTLTTRTLAFGTALGFIAKSILDTGASFDQTMTNAAANFNLVERDETFTKLKNAAKKWGEETEFSAIQAANALNFFAKAGISADAAILLLPRSLAAATAAQIELGEATDLFTDSMGLLGKGVDKADKNFNQKFAKNFADTADFMLNTARNSNQTIRQLFETFKQSAPIARELGVEMEELGLLTAILANNGIKAEKSGTGLKNALFNLTALTPRAKRAFKDLGVEVNEVVGGLETPKKKLALLTEISKAIKKVPEVQRGGIIEAIFGKIGLAAALTLGGQTAATIEDLRKKLANFEGTAEEMAEFIRNTLSNDFIRFSSMVKSVSIEITEFAETAIRPTVKAMTAWLKVNKMWIAQKIGGFFKFVANNIKAIAIGLGVLVGMTLAITLLAGALAGLLTVIIGIEVAAAVLLNPISLVIGAFTILAGTAAFLITNWNMVKAWFLSMPDWLLGVVAIVAFKLTIIAFIAKQVMRAWAPVKSFFKNLWDGIVGIFESAMARLGPILEPFLDSLRAIKTGLGTVGAGVRSTFGADEDNNVDRSENDSSSSVDSRRGANLKPVENLLTISTPAGTSAELSGGKIAGLKMRITGSFA